VAATLVVVPRPTVSVPLLDRYTLAGGFQGVVADRQEREAVIAIGISGHGTGKARFWVAYGDLRPRR